MKRNKTTQLLVKTICDIAGLISSKSAALHIKGLFKFVLLKSFHIRSYKREWVNSKERRNWCEQFSVS